MSTKDRAINILSGLDDEQLLDFMKLYADDETLALAESEYIGNHPEKRKHYKNFRELLDEIENEDNDLL